MKAHPDLSFTSAVVIFSMGNTVTFDSWVQGVEAFRSIVPAITSAGGYALYVYAQGYFQLSPAIIRNKTVTEVANIMEPFLTKLTTLGIPYTKTITTYPNFFEAYSGSFNNSVFMIQNAQSGGRIVPKSVWDTESSMTTYNLAVRKIIASGVGSLDLAFAPTSDAAGHPDNAVFPPWRNAQVHQGLFT
jgi:hypothetical protein